MRYKRAITLSKALSKIRIDIQRIMTNLNRPGNIDQHIKSRLLEQSDEAKMKQMVQMIIAAQTAEILQLASFRIILLWKYIRYAYGLLMRFIKTCFLTQ